MSTAEEQPVYSIERGDADLQSWQRLVELAGSMGAQVVERVYEQPGPETDATIRYINPADFVKFTDSYKANTSLAIRAYNGLAKIYFDQYNEADSEIARLPHLQFDRLPQDLSRYPGMIEGKIGDLRIDSLKQFVERFDERLATVSGQTAKKRVYDMLPRTIGPGVMDFYRAYVNQNVDDIAK